MRTALGGLSRRVIYDDFDSAWFRQREAEMGLDHRVHRKHWEHAIVAQIFRTHVRQVRPRLLGFGVGREPTTAWFAASGADVLATDMPEELVTEAWRNDETPQHSANLAEIPYEGITSTVRFRNRVEFRPVDMTDIPDDLKRGKFDMTWSCGSCEHIGGIEPGLDFLVDQMDCLKKNGLAVHTTEYNVVSDEETLDEHDICIFRKSDLKRLEERLADAGHLLWPLQLCGGDKPEDQLIDDHPYDGDIHINIGINNQHVSTSVLLVAQAGGAQ